MDSTLSLRLPPTPLPVIRISALATHRTGNVSLQRDLPGSLQLVATYLGIKGTRGVQEFLPNTYPAGATNPCPACPSGFAYLASNGNSTHEAGQVQLRRRLHNGLTASVRYTYSKSIDDDSALGGQGATAITQNTPSSQFSAGAASSSGGGGGSLTLAQNWLNLRAERGLSDLRSAPPAYRADAVHHRNGHGWQDADERLERYAVQGMDMADPGFRGQRHAGNAHLPCGRAGHGSDGKRPAGLHGGAPLYSAPSGLFLNPAAYAAPPAGQWGNAGRDSIIGPTQFSLSTSMGRTFRLNSRFNLDLRVDSTNFLNHVTYTGWDTTTTSAQFGLPTAASAMRSLQTTLRLRF